MKKTAWVFVICGSLFVAWGFFLQSINGSKAQVERAICRDNLHAIGLALENYHDTHGSYPPAFIPDKSGKPMHSWRVLLLPYLDQQNLYKQYRFDEPWNSEWNLRLCSQYTFPGSCCPYHCPRSKSPDPLEANYVVVTGQNTVWPRNKSIQRADLKDDPATTIAVIEVAQSGIKWYEPRDLSIEDFDPQITHDRSHSISSDHNLPGGHVLWMNVNARFMTTDVSPQTIKAMLTRDGREQIPVP